MKPEVGADRFGLPFLATLNESPQLAAAAAAFATCEKSGEAKMGYGSAMVHTH